MGGDAGKELGDVVVAIAGCAARERRGIVTRLKLATLSTSAALEVMLANRTTRGGS